MLAPVGRVPLPLDEVALLQPDDQAGAHPHEPGDVVLGPGEALLDHGERPEMFGLQPGFAQVLANSFARSAPSTMSRKAEVSGKELSVATPVL
ncbi:hypothetical protein SAMN05421854_104390 [Amycolatopsis rubida]|uniref:Uncharacterized protein n=1 Tax=Amycolatopsis rubida TaxID=112413 RepID=A0A1I5NHX1_9PSEU|nr:hypothetical protein [Amycolatopsis rubida]SFP20946.1 hypothetical protein SAMN05421854_104390 [Amycolatopsis rubida]